MPLNDPFMSGHTLCQGVGAEMLDYLTRRYKGVAPAQHLSVQGVTYATMAAPKARRLKPMVVCPGCGVLMPTSQRRTRCVVCAEARRETLKALNDGRRAERTHNQRLAATEGGTEDSSPCAWCGETFSQWIPPEGGRKRKYCGAACTAAAHAEQARKSRQR
jgi:hypothetical protein